MSTAAWDDFVARAQAMLADHEPPQPLCVHLPGYGTRSATLLAIGEAGLERYLHADGPPCQATLQPREDLVAALRAAR